MTPLVIPEPVRKVDRISTINSLCSLYTGVDHTMSTSTDVIELSLGANESFIEASSSVEDVFEDLGDAVDQDFGSLALEESSHLITIEQANSRLSNAILDSLLKNFNGKVSRVRNIDSRDRLF